MHTLTAGVSGGRGSRGRGPFRVKGLACAQKELKDLALLYSDFETG